MDVDGVHLTEFDRCVQQAEAAIIRGLVADGAVEQTVPSSLCSEEALAPWTTTNEAGQRVLNISATEQSEGRTILEHSLRQACASLISYAAEHSIDATQYRHDGSAEPSIPRLLDLTVHLGSQKKLDAGLVFTIMEDVMELSTIEEAQGVFGYLESRIKKLRQVYNFSSEKSLSKLSVLRICNQLLRRLSRASSSELCGRILMFLTRLLPLLDRSGLNVQGQFNTSHSTPVEDGAVDSNGKPVDAGFYATFWGLQASFQQPYAVMEPSKWAATIADIKRVLAEFTKQPVALASSSGGEGGDVLEEAALTVKYLSSPKLMRLQLSDAALRRHFLLQALVFLHACQHPVLKPGTQQAKQAKQEALRSKQLSEAEELEGLLYAELQRTPKHGAEFCVAVRTILHRETQWAKWKSEGCQGYEKAEVAQLTPLELSAAALRMAAPSSKPQRIDTGSDALSRLWNITRDNVSCLKGEANRRKAPSLKEFLAPVIMEMDPDEGIEEQYKTKKDAVYTWKALRQMSRASLPVFSKMLSPTQPKARKGAATKEDKKERDGEARPRLDLEDAVHDLFPDDVPEGARRKPAAAVSASAAVSEATEAAAARSGADGDADPGAVSSAVAPAVAAAADKPLLAGAGQGTGGDADANPVLELAALPEAAAEAGTAEMGVPEEAPVVKEESVSEEAAVGVKAEPSGAAEAAGLGPGQQEVAAGPSSGTAEETVQPAVEGAAGMPEAAEVGKAAAGAAGMQPSERGHITLNGMGNGAAQPAAVEDDADMAEASAADGGVDGEEEDGEVEGGGRKGRSRAGSKREQPDGKHDAAVDEADGKAEEVTRATRGSKRAKTAVQ
ncbi:probable THO complex subunit 1 [Coccomyxa sp. Obi]|nr:probable THO complex subunit 1 [Coccomyxa sp. Obi]